MRTLVGVEGGVTFDPAASLAAALRVTLAEVDGLVKSTRHHLAQLRAAGVVDVSGNARAVAQLRKCRADDEVGASRAPRGAGQS